MRDVRRLVSGGGPARAVSRKFRSWRDCVEGISRTCGDDGEFSGRPGYFEMRVFGGHGIAAALVIG